MCSRPQFTDLTYMGGTRSCGPKLPIFNTDQHMGNRSVRLDAIVFTTDGHMDGRTDGQTDIAQMSQNFTLIKCLQGTQGPRSLFLGVTNVLTKLFHVRKARVYRFDLYERYRTMQTDDDNFWQGYLELVHKPKYQIWCESDVPCAQDPSLPI